MGYSAYSSASGQRIGAHAVDGDTIAHWEFDGDALEPVNNYDKNATTFTRANSLTADARQVLVNITDAGGFAVGATLCNINAAVTVACWFLPMGTVAGNSAVFGMRASGSGATNNFPWTVDLQSGGNLRFFWQSGTKSPEEIAGGTVLTIGEWVHVIGTRDAGGAGATTGKLYLNGVVDGSSSTKNPVNDGSNQNACYFMNDGAAGTPIAGSLATAIVKNVFVNDAQALALYQSAIAV